MKNHQDYLKEIAATGLSQAQIGERLGKTQSWVSAAMKGLYADLKWNEGQAIRQLHAEICRPEYRSGTERPDLYPNPSDTLPQGPHDGS